MRDRLRAMAPWLLAGVFLLSGCASAGSATPTVVLPTRIVQEVRYAAMTPEEVVDAAQAILWGRVLTVTPSRWNQDSGEYWQSSGAEIQNLQYYEITLDVIQVITDGLGLESQPVVTVMGPSPADPEAESVNPKGSLAFRQGEEVILLLQRVPMVWRDGSRERLVLTGGPQGVYRVTDDGYARSPASPTRDMKLELLLGMISQRKNVSVWW